MKVLHTYCLNYNLGDYYLGIGVKNLLRKYLPVELISETNIQGTIFDKYFIHEVVNKRYDLLVIGGGGIIHGAHWPNGWFWLINQELIKEITIPFIVYGVGYNYFKGETEIPENGVEHLKETIKHASYFSVRNDRSVERLEKQTEIKALEIPDPGFHVNLSEIYPKPIESDYVLIQLANDKPDYRYKNENNRNKFIEDMKKVSRYIKNLGLKVILAPHVYDDIAICEEVASDGSAEVWNFSEFAFDHSEKSLAYYQHANFVLSMRGHGQIIPISYNVPVISLENHNKNKGLMQKLSIEEWNIDILSSNFLRKVIQLVDKMNRENVKIRKMYVDINNQLESETEQAFSIIKRNLNI